MGCLGSCSRLLKYRARLPSCASRDRGGGYALDAAGALAAHGFVTFALAYYAVPGLPDDLMEIPLEYLETGINWLANLPDVKGVAVMGRSKGGELALLLGSLFDSIRAIVAYVPSSQTHCWGEPDARKSCWTYKGKPFPYVPMDGSRNPPMENGRLLIRAGYEATIKTLRLPIVLPSRWSVSIARCCSSQAARTGCGRRACFPSASSNVHTPMVSNMR